MKNACLKKSFICVIIVLFVGTSSVSSIARLDNENVLVENNQSIQTGEYTTQSLYQIGTLGDAPWWNTNWMYRKQITIDHNQVAGNLVNFPVLIITTMDTSKVQTDGDDIVFTDNYGTKLNHEIESYNSSTGELIAWVNIISLSLTEDTIIWIYYGNPYCANQQNVGGTWDSNYVAVWHFSETSGNIVKDSTVNHFDAIANEYTPVSDGFIGGARSFNGGDGAVYVGFHEEFGGMPSYSIETYAYPYSINNERRIFDRSESYDINPNTILFCLYNGPLLIETNNFDNTFFNNPISANTWKYLSAVFSGSGGEQALFVNGIKVASSTTTTYGPTAGSFNVTIGDCAFGWDYPWDGKLDEMRFSNIARTWQWISTSYNSMNSPSTFMNFGEEQPLTPNIVYVDDDYTSSTPGWGYDHFNHIQDGINAVAEHGTVYVYSGMYYENVIVNKTINLVGEDKDNTIIDAHNYGHAVEVLSNGSKLCNFTATNCTSPVNGGAGIALTSVSNINIYNVKCPNNHKGIVLFDSHRCILNKTECYGNYAYGILIRDNSGDNLLINNKCMWNGFYNLCLDDSGENNILINNTIAYPEGCYGLLLSGSSGNKILNCTFHDSQRDIGLSGSHNNFIIGNHLSSLHDNLGLWASNGNIVVNNTIEGGALGISLSGSEYNILSDNTINNHWWGGILLGDNCVYNTINDCILKDIHNGDGIKLDHSNYNVIDNCLIYNCSSIGCNLSESSNNIFSRNKVTNNHFGILCSNSDYIQIKNCSCYNNNDDGIRINSCQNSSILNCTIYDNGDDGIDLSWAPCINNIISENNCTNNRHGIVLFQSDYNIVYKNELFSNRGYGIYPWSSSNNIIYYNYLINNNQNAYDANSNTWYNGSSHEGNYWSDYPGVDANGDGIGDTPYDIPGGNNQDLYPLGYFHNIPPVANFIYNPSSPTDLDVIHFTDTSTDSDGTITSWNWNFGDGNTSAIQNPTHKYADEGTYHVTLTVTDDDGASNSISKDVIVSNVPPVAEAGGPYYGRKGETVIFDASSSKDKDGSIVSYKWDFGDGSTGSGSIIGHQYNSNGNYVATLTIKDDDGANGSDTAQVYIITGNLPPYIPKNPHPENNAFDVPINTSLSWTGGDPDTGDTVTYDVYFGTTNPPTIKVASNQSALSYVPTLTYNTTYYWKIVAWDNHGNKMNGRVWIFTTIRNNPPNKPSTPSGPANGKIKIEYTYISSTTDPDGDKVFYMWDWGDGKNIEWLGPYDSGVTINASHNWTVKGSYSIKVKAKDIYGHESNWSDPLPITMPYSFNRPLQQFLELLFQRFPHAFPILRHLLGY